jgi:hypothetical protein
MTSVPAPVTMPQKALEAHYVSWAKAEKASGGRKGRHSRIVADYIRHALSRLGSEDGTAGAVHIQRLLTAVRTQLGWLVPPVDEPPWAEHDHSPDDDPAEPTSTVKGLLLLTLERLILIGDCGTKGEGYYLPAPVRKVILESGESFIVGGMDTNSLARQSTGVFGWAGLARTMEQATGDYPAHDVNRWLGRPAEALPIWTTNVFRRAALSLEKSPGRESSEFEIYSPHSFPGRGQSNRWSSPQLWTPPQGDGGRTQALHLCRTRRRPREFWLSPLEQKSREVTFRLEAVVPRAEARRLMYGIDLLHGVPTRADVAAQGTTDVRFKLFSWLPTEELRLFSALCYQEENAPDTPLPFTFHVPTRYWPDVASTLKGLGIITPDPRR